MLLYDFIIDRPLALALGLLSLGCSPSGDAGDAPAGGTSEGSTGDTGATEPPESPTTSADHADDADSSSGEPDVACGNGQVEPGEECDGLDVSGLGCSDVDPTLHGGPLACEPDCTFDTTACDVLPNPVQQCQLASRPILDYTTMTDTLVLPPELLGRTIVDVDVEVEVEHSYIGDLIIGVVHDDTTVGLHEGCRSQDALHVIYDDAAQDDDYCRQAALGLSVVPLGELADFNGASIGPDWTLSIEDRAGFDEGTLQRWCVSISWS